MQLCWKIQRINILCDEVNVFLAGDMISSQLHVGWKSVCVYLYFCEHNYFHLLATILTLSCSWAGDNNWTRNLYPILFWWSREVLIEFRDIIVTSYVLILLDNLAHWDIYELGPRDTSVFDLSISQSLELQRGFTHQF